MSVSLGGIDGRSASEARSLSKRGEHEEAAGIYADLHSRGRLQPDDRKAWGWDLYRLIKNEFTDSDNDVSSTAARSIKRHLHTYLVSCWRPVAVPQNPAIANRLQSTFQRTDRTPGRTGSPNLHSLMLNLALRLAKKNNRKDKKEKEYNLKLVPFLRLWDLSQLSDADFTKQTGSYGKSYASLAERTIQAAAKQAADSDRQDELSFILPHVETGMERFPENIWLKCSLAKILRSLGRVDEARALAIEFAREKATDAWAWDLIGQLAPDDPSLQLSCYAKALSCSRDDKFVCKVRLKLAGLLACDHPAAARFEVERVLSCADAGRSRIQEAQELAKSAWFKSVAPQVTDRNFYARFTEKAETLLFAHLPWKDASLGDVFTIEGKDGKRPRPMRRIYVRDKPIALELSVSDSHPDVRGLKEGAPLLVQYETSEAEPGRTRIHRLRARTDGEHMDVVSEQVGVIDHVNSEKSLMHVVVALGIADTCPISACPGAARVGAFVAVRVARRHGRNGYNNRIIMIRLSEQTPTPHVYLAFREEVKVTGGGFGFTEGDIFIPPHIIASAGISSGDVVEGAAILSLDKKKHKWGMKAFEARSVGEDLP